MFPTGQVGKRDKLPVISLNAVTPNSLAGSVVQTVDNTTISQLNSEAGMKVAIR
jgi:hypothetical protein